MTVLSAIADLKTRNGALGFWAQRCAFLPTALSGLRPIACVRHNQKVPKNAPSKTVI